MHARQTFFALFVLAMVIGSAAGCGDGGPSSAPDAGTDAGGSVRDGSVSDRDGAGDGGCAPEVELCDGEDDDCDGRIDESVSVACGTDVGACVAGSAACIDGAPGECVGAIEPTTESCNGIDDSCDGLVDEGCPCTEGATQPCGTDTGECAAGTQICAAGAWGTCEGELTGTAETCNGRDDNCDGILDDGFGVGASCDGEDSDRCEEGTTMCTLDGTGVVCTDSGDDDAETCDGTNDEDCDLAIDEGCSCVDGMTRPCGSMVGECRLGTQRCTAGAWGACTGGVIAVPELCNGLDDDCDGASDDGFALGGTCDGGDTDACAEGTIVCAADGAGTSCSDSTGDSVEVCNGLDDDCDGSIDDGLGTHRCGTGACLRTTPACIAGIPQSCMPGPPGTETCNGADDDCDGTSDEGFGTMSCGVGGCMRTVPACSGGVPGMCTPGPMMPETCNSLDEDCDGTSDEGLGTISCGTGACMRTIAACVGGAPQTCTPLPAGPESCNGADDDCDGTIDEGNPGGGLPCAGGDIGGCLARTTCVGGMLLCRGTFVAPSPIGAATNDGSRTSPLSSISSAIANAVAIGGGADVCVCDTSAAGASVFAEDVTMVEGVSVLGGYDCSSWGRPGGRTTSIDDADADGLVFPSGITAATRLEQMTVIGRSSVTLGASSTAITIDGSSPVLESVIVDGGDATTTRGIECTGCNAVLNNVTVQGGIAASSAIGLHASGAIGSLAITGGSYSAGATAGSGSASIGIQLEACTGAPAISNATTFGGSTPGAASRTGARTGIEATGALCAPAVRGGQHRGCESGSTTCTGISCSMGARCDVSDASGAGGAPGIVGASSGAVIDSYGLRCLGGGCGTIRGNLIAAGVLGSSSSSGIGVEIDGGSPAIDDNQVIGPDGRPGSPPSGRFFALFVRASSSIITNNVLLDGDWSGETDVVRLEISPGGVIQPTLHSNTIQYESCTGCGNRFGLAIAGAGSPLGVIRNNLIEHNATGNIGGTRPVIERGTMCDFSIFENNSLYDPNYVLTGGYYLDEGSTAITVTTLNTYPMHTGNIGINCSPSGSWHIASGSPCHDAGTASGAPRTDFDGEARPRSGTAPDIGADEFYP